MVPFEGRSRGGNTQEAMVAEGGPTGVVIE
jgi:hypothetical protein